MERNAVAHREYWKMHSVCSRNNPDATGAIGKHWEASGTIRKQREASRTIWKHREASGTWMNRYATSARRIRKARQHGCW